MKFSIKRVLESNVMRENPSSASIAWQWFNLGISSRSKEESNRDRQDKKQNKKQKKQS
jgi:hypothetical protein